MRKRYRAVLFVVIGVVLLCLTGIGFKWGVDFWESRALNQLANRLGIEPSWADFELYLDEVFVIGMTRDDVLREVSRIGPYTIEPKAGVVVHEETIVFDFNAMGFPPLMSRKHSWLVLRYDENQIVTHIYRYEPNLW